MMLVKTNIDEVNEIIKGINTFIKKGEELNNISCKDSDQQIEVMKKKLDLYGEFLKYEQQVKKFKIIFEPIGNI